MRGANSECKYYGIAPQWGDAYFTGDNDTCFVIMPFDKELDGAFEAIRSVCKDLEFRCDRADMQFGTHEIMQKVWRNICNSTAVITDLKGLDPNVVYELGLAHAIPNDVLPITQDDPVIVRRPEGT